MSTNINCRMFYRNCCGHPYAQMSIFSSRICILTKGDPRITTCSEQVMNPDPRAVVSKPEGPPNIRFGGCTA